MKHDLADKMGVLLAGLLLLLILRIAWEWWQPEPVAETVKNITKQNAEKTKENHTESIPEHTEVGIFSTSDYKELVTLAHAAKALALLFAADDQFAGQTGAWYEAYITYLGQCGLWQDLDHEYASSENIAVTGADLKRLLAACQERFLTQEQCETLSFLVNTEENAIHPDGWWDFYTALAAEFGCESRIRTVEFDVYATCVTQEGTAGIYTDMGVIGTNGFEMEEYVDHRLRGRIVSGELISYEVIPGQKVIYDNAFLTKAEEHELEFLYHGMKKTYCFADRLPKLSEGYPIASVVFLDGSLAELCIKQEMIAGDALYNEKDGLFLQEKGMVYLDERTCIYRISESGEIYEGALSDIHYGDAKQQYVLEGDRILAVIIEDRHVPENIRVLISDAYETGHEHGEVVIHAEGGCRLLRADTMETVTEAERLKLTPMDMPDDITPMLIVPRIEGQPLCVESITRNGACPSYEGRLEVRRTSAGGLILVNELALEDYLKYVVPGEMPASYGLEAAKVQAVCARSYAVKQMQSGKLLHLGAHVDDTTAYQVYNHSGLREVSTQGVFATQGEVLYSEAMQDIIVTYYFSTSCGSTTDAAVWLEDPSAAPYLKECMVTEGSFDTDLRNEENFRQFLLADSFFGEANREGLHCLEEECAWFRWECEISMEELSRRLDRNLYSRSSANPNLILRLNSAGAWEPCTLSTIGSVKSIVVAERGAGGIVSKLMITGTLETILVLKQGNIRALLGDSSQIYRNKSGMVSGKSTFPSAFFVLEPAGDEAAPKVRICGGGYGHGVGLSQNGAKKLADQGMSYRDILAWFYRDCVVI